MQRQPRRTARRGRNTRVNNNNRATKNGRTRRAPMQGPASGSRADTTAQRKAMIMYKTVHIDDASSGVAFGIGNMNIQANTSSPYLAEILDLYKTTYEQYRIRRVRIYATPGKNFTNDIRIKTQVACRVDRDNMPTVPGAKGLGLLLGSANTIVKTLTERGNVIIADYNPVCTAYQSGASTTDGRQLPNSLQWFGISNTDRHAWRGATIAVLTPDEGYLPGSTPTISLRVRIDLQFRGRIVAQSTFSSLSINIEEPVTYDLTETQDTLRTNLLNGTYFPIDLQGLNVGNIGFSVTDAELIGCQFRIQATMETYEIMNAESPVGSDRMIYADKYI